MPTQLERLASLESGIKNLDEKVVAGFKTVNDKVDEFIEGADAKYASKLTQIIVYGLVASILLLFFKINYELPAAAKTPPQQTVTITTESPNGTKATSVVPLTGTGQVIQVSPGEGQASTSTPVATTDSSTQPNQRTEQPKSGICAVPLVGALCQ